MSRVITNTGKEFQSNDGESILDAALRSGIQLEHSCKTGRCGTCVAKLRRGTTALICDEIGLGDREKSEGCVLTCARRAADAEIEIEVDELTNVQLPVRKTLPCRIHQLERLGRDVMKIMLRFPPAQRLDYLPGQYVDVIAPGGVKRSYSIANANSAEAPLIELHVRHVDGGVMSRYWFQQAAVNDLLRIHGPNGTFFLRDAARHVIFLATGVGIAPFKAMLEQLSRAACSEWPESLRLYWGSRTPGDFYWTPPLGKLPLQFTPVLSRPEANWTGERGYVQQTALQAAPDLSRAVVYACGSPAMIASAKNEFIARGLNPRCFHSDAFVSSSTEVTS